ncbi:hypothetical protein CDV55_101480 [Aspergillus turcosus]|uniref:L-ascorbate oxidase n=1 Tax=Aspergillus turcosus TaxID=1245748 RepID=A0A229WZJ2_9EURO|nr:hypothetical protein CDV55_101480 [Aspergillus turcosus]RLL95208.1 hypothetical protein CFD26_103880 [Aspergillus turcosus]
MSWHENKLSCIILFILSCFTILATSHRVVKHDETFVPDLILRVTWENVSQPCVPTKPVALVNGTSPGPAIYLEEDVTTWIRVYNDMPNQNLTMHWHGLKMALFPFSDGTPQAAQWPIPPMHFFDYEIRVPVGMAGTYYYHSHVGIQAVSVNGPLIVKDKCRPPYEYDEERIIHFTDVFNGTNAAVTDGVLANPISFAETAGILINGKGGGVASGYPCNSSLSVIDVEPGKTYRLRFIGATALTFSSFAIEGHDVLTVIEADGQYTKPVDVRFMQVTIGQTFSALLRTRDDIKSGQFYMQVESRERPTTATNYAILNYGPKHSEPLYPPVTPPLTLPPTDVNWLEYTLEPLFDNNFPTLEEVTRRVYIDVQQVSVNGKKRYFFNNVTWTSAIPREPYLVSLYKNDGGEFPSMERALAHGGVDPVVHAWPAEIGEVLEIVLQNVCDGTGEATGGFDTHPFHAHGLHFYDIGSGNGTYDFEENEKRMQGWHPAQRDTTPLFRYLTEGVPGTKMGWRAWRLRIQDPGVWMIHCHIEEHMAMGMQMVWVFGNHTEVLKLPINDVTGYLTYGGNVAGNVTHWPVVVEVHDDWMNHQ